MGLPGTSVDRLRGRLRGRGTPPGPGRVLDLPSARVHVQVFEEADEDGRPTVVYLPDPPNGLDSAGPFLAALAAEHRVVAFELPGFGWSRAKPGFGFGNWDHAGVLDEVLTATGTERVVLVAPCLTGYVALAYTHAHTERVAGLVLPQVTDWGHALQWVDRIDPRGTLQTPWKGQFFTWLGESTIAARWYQMAEPDPQQRDRFLQTFRSRPRSGRLFSLASGIQALGAVDPLAGRTPLATPALLLWGSGDPTHDGSHAHGLATHLPAAQTVTVPAGHFPELAHPHAVLEWLRAVVDARP